jgi:hypothetical protein
LCSKSTSQIINTPGALGVQVDAVIIHHTRAKIGISRLHPKLGNIMMEKKTNFPGEDDVSQTTTAIDVFRGDSRNNDLLYPHVDRKSC